MEGIFNELYLLRNTCNVYILGFEHEAVLWLSLAATCLTTGPLWAVITTSPTRKECLALHREGIDSRGRRSDCYNQNYQFRQEQ